MSASAAALFRAAKAEWDRLMRERMAYATEILGRPDSRVIDLERLGLAYDAPGTPRDSRRLN